MSCMWVFVKRFYFRGRADAIGDPVTPPPMDWRNDDGRQKERAGRGLSQRPCNPITNEGIQTFLLQAHKSHAWCQLCNLISDPPRSGLQLHGSTPHFSKKWCFSAPACVSQPQLIVEQPLSALRVHFYYPRSQKSENSPFLQSSDRHNDLFPSRLEVN